MSENTGKTTALRASLAAAAASAALLLPAAVLPAGQPTAVSNLPVAVTGRHKQHGKPQSKSPQPANTNAGDGKTSEKK
jgi:hypothetical protein